MNYDLKLSNHSQVLIEITEASSVITWDFDVCKGDVIFNIYHSRRAPQPVKRDGLSAHNLAGPAGNNVQLIDRSWMLGQDYSMVQTALTCREGESVQVRESQETRQEHGSKLNEPNLFLLWFSSALSGISCSALAWILRPAVASLQQPIVHFFQSAACRWCSGLSAGLLTQMQSHVFHRGAALHGLQVCMIALQSAWHKTIQMKQLSKEAHIWVLLLNIKYHLDGQMFSLKVFVVVFVSGAPWAAWSPVTAVSLCSVPPPPPPANHRPSQPSQDSPFIQTERERL